MKLLALLLCASTLQAAGPALTTAAALSTLIANTDAVVHPIVTAKHAGHNAKRVVTLGRKNDGKLHTLPVPHAAPEPKLNWPVL